MDGQRNLCGETTSHPQNQSLRRVYGPNHRRINLSCLDGSLRPLTTNEGLPTGPPVDLLVSQNFPWVSFDDKKEWRVTSCSTKRRTSSVSKQSWGKTGNNNYFAIVYPPDADWVVEWLGIHGWDEWLGMHGRKWDVIRLSGWVRTHLRPDLVTKPNIIGGFKCSWTRSLTLE